MQCCVACQGRDSQVVDEPTGLQVCMTCAYELKRLRNLPGRIVVLDRYNEVCLTESAANDTKHTP